MIAYQVEYVCEVIGKQIVFFSNYEDAKQWTIFKEDQGANLTPIVIHTKAIPIPADPI